MVIFVSFFFVLSLFLFFCIIRELLWYGYMVKCCFFCLNGWVSDSVFMDKGEYK